MTQSILRRDLKLKPYKYQEANRGAPSTNNGIEGTNGVMKGQTSKGQTASQHTRSLLITKRGRKPDTAEVKAAKEAKKLEAKEAKKQETQARKKAKLS